MSRNLLLYLAAFAAWAVGRREGRDQGRRDGYQAAAADLITGLRKDADRG